jgi:UPF0755 protein
MKRIFLVLSFIILLPLLYIFFLLSPTSLSSEQIRFVVPLEAKQEEIINRLKAENYVRSTRLLSFFLGLIKFPGSLEPGAYMLSRSMNTIQIADTLLNHPYQKWIILVPGLRVEQTAEKLAKKFGWSSEKTKEFLDNAREGYMFPDTYLLNTDYSGKEFAQRMTSNFNEHFDAQMQKDLLAQDVRNDTAIKIASLIERESGGDSDRAEIAGIIWNRLNKGMKLEIDATVQYALGKPDNWWRSVTGSDMRSTDSPYNTYNVKGLPPGPICSPSLSSIKAAVYPAETDCFYYLHDHNKQIHCARTYEEHKENIEKYLQ